MSEPIKLERRGSVAVVTLNRPEVRNALNYELFDMARDVLIELSADDTCRAVVLTGAGDKAFCAGMDLNVVRELNADTVGDWMARNKIFYEAIRGLDKPIVAALNGVAAAAGYQVALLCDIRVGHAGTRMGQPEINVGLASLLGTQIMYPFLGHARTVELSLTGRLMDANECLQVGLLQHLVDREAVLDKALEIAAELGQKPPVAMRITKQRLRDIGQAEFDAVFEDAVRLQVEAYEAGEPQRAMAEFLAKR